MTIWRKSIGAIAVAALLSGCALPRGAALQSEITKNADDENAQFAVHPVTKTFLPRYAKWPSTGGVSRFSWISKQRGPIGRVILSGDKISIAIWDSDENSLLTAREQKVAQLQTIGVSTNGSVFVPYVGSVTIGGMTDSAAREKIQEALLAVSPSAQVQLSSVAGSRHSVSIVSGVNSPGTFPIEERDMTVLTALSLGGGAKDRFENPQIRLLRGNNTYAISLDRLLKSPALDTTLRSGDKIVVAEDESYFLALGASGKEELITFPKEHVSALDAVSLMGGLSDSRANPEGILVLREYSPKAVRADGVSGPENERVVFTMDLTSADGLFSAGKFRINPKDVVYATESPVNNARTIIGLIGSGFGIASQVN
ncbi:polysaccharide export outer membrane protein [Litoreibacter ascidiaceicola]|uniref:Polysaccharide export outer membrane protein n=1 Tax=Litoreibacter ascidiaceicola TaxID=1486859 RepID=A0A1M5E9V9_9RHOB|nr:polysaccharide biosynthesis/export family protein [Litoreibacter ascidiaceicola]SHF76029.1 polysaccharide export outer membrane protein [Litoreibacter ascidiaceicola]